MANVVRSRIMKVRTSGKGESGNVLVKTTGTHNYSN